MRIFWQRSILVRAAIQVIAIGLVVGIAFVFLTARLSERNARQVVVGHIEELLTTVESTVRLVCLTRDRQLASEVASGLLQNSGLSSVLIEADGEILAEQHKGTSDDDRRAAANGRIRQTIASPDDPAVAIGAVVIDLDPAVIRERVHESGAFVALLLGLQSLAVVAAVAAAVLLWIVRPIKRLSDRLHVMEAHSVELLPVPHGHEQTEIGRLVADINQIGQRLASSLQEEHRLHGLREVGERKYRAIFENAESGIFVVDRQLRLESCNSAFRRQLDLPTDATHAAHEFDILRLRWKDAPALRAMLERCVDGNRSLFDDFEYEGANGARWFGITLTPVGDGHLQGQLTDISRHKYAEMLAQQGAVTDSLTGLLNREGFQRRLDAEIATKERGEAEGFALLTVDLDGFRRVNESLGMHSGDRILTLTAGRLRACVKNSDIVARLGNDAFGLILQDAGDKAATGVATRIQQALKEYIELGQEPLQLAASIGIALFPQDGLDRASLLRNSEMALNHARSSGGGRHLFFELFMAQQLGYRRQLEDDLRFAIRRGELSLHFQPIVDLALGHMSGVEALLRWRHPQHGMIPPDIFIPLAEGTGEIVRLGQWVVETVCQQLAAWRRQGVDYHVSINVSAKQIPDGLAPITLIETVDRYGVDPSRLAIEITESVFMGNSETAQTWLDAVHDLGFQIHLDDFGTGYSSLSYIKRYPVDVLKIDKSFVRDMGDDDGDRALVGAIINMANGLGLTVVAEGVETQRQLELLDQAGCRCVQGYYFSRPAVADEVVALDGKIVQLLAANRAPRLI